MKIVVLGAGGQLGLAICRSLSGIVAAWTRAELDVTNTAALREKLLAAQPEVVINASGFTRVDRAEDEAALAFGVNALAVRELAFLCRELDAVLIHFSTNYVFGSDSLRDSPYDEDDLPGPLGVYGASKLAGEQFVKAHWHKHFLLRTSGLYGHQLQDCGRINFVEAILKQAASGACVRVVSDQICTPTYVDDLADAVAEVIQSQAWGLYHVTNTGACSWHEFAQAIVELAEVATEVKAIGMSEFQTQAQRPRYSVLSNRRWLNAGLRGLRPWREALEAYLKSRSTFDAQLLEPADQG